jgi:CheY-like chemotaxis protein
MLWGIGCVLIVDDSVDTCKVLVCLFCACGHAAEALHCGEDALARLTDPARERPALVLLDVMMPGIDGLTVLEWVRGTPDLAGLPVVLYTAGHDPDVVERGTALGAQGVVMKAGGREAL